MKTEAVHHRPYSRRVSAALALRLLGVATTGLDAFAVIDELDYLEGMKSTTRTKAEMPFDHAPLAPFWHKHFATARHVVLNIGIRWNLHRGGNKDLTKLLEDIAGRFGDDPDAWTVQLAHALVVGGFEDRHKRGLTGDWIIFAKHDGMNYYLDLACHEEGLPENASALLKKLSDGCAAEFPFLFAATKDA